MKKIPFKNYILLAVLLIVSALVYLFVINLFNKKEVKTENFFKQLNYEELENYIVENPNIIIYLSDNNYTTTKFYKKFKKFIVNNNLDYQVIYIDRNDITKEQFDKLLKEYYENDSKFSLKNYIIIFDNQKIYSIDEIDDNQTDMSFIKKKLVFIGEL